MSHCDRTYIIFDGENDIWAYSYMKGWKVNERIDFAFVDAHDLLPITSRAENETYVKSRLHERLRQSRQVVVLVGEKTKNLYRLVRWDVELALEFRLPIIVANLNNRRMMDQDRCPALLRDEDTVHVSFNLAIIRYALDNFPAEHAQHRYERRGPRHYGNTVYESLGL
jgi:hypothetical protein